MFLYAIGIIFSPGPVSVLAINIGANNKINESIGFYIGVGLSMVLYIIILGGLGTKMIRQEFQFFLNILSSIYIIFLGYKIWNSQITLDSSFDNSILKFKDGFVIQTINPKAMLACLPLVTVYFPNNNIVGSQIIIASIIIGILSFSSPIMYSFVGKFLNNTINFSILNRTASIILILIAISILWNDVYLFI